MAHYVTIAAAVLVFMVGCYGDDDAAWARCDAQGRTLTCDTPGTRTLFASKYNPAGKCFEAVAALSNVCAGPSSCASGTGMTICAVAPSGDAYLTFLLYGELTSRADWHFEDTNETASTLTASDDALCRELRSMPARLVDADGGAEIDMALLGRTDVVVTPACD